jgi:hypothetical protein
MIIKGAQSPGLSDAIQCYTTLFKRVFRVQVTDRPALAQIFHGSFSAGFGDDNRSALACSAMTRPPLRIASVSYFCSRLSRVMEAM